jgi:hypothetical protein
MIDLNKKQKLLLAFQYCWAWYNIDQYIIRFYSSIVYQIRDSWYSLDFWLGVIFAILTFPLLVIKHFIISPFVIYYSKQTDWNYLRESKKFKFNYWDHKEYKREQERKRLLER